MNLTKLTHIKKHGGSVVLHTLKKLLIMKTLFQWCCLFPAGYFHQFCKGTVCICLILNKYAQMKGQVTSETFGKWAPNTRETVIHLCAKSPAIYNILAARNLFNDCPAGNERRLTVRNHSVGSVVFDCGSPMFFFFFFLKPCAFCFRPEAIHLSHIYHISNIGMNVNMWQ